MVRYTDPVNASPEMPFVRNPPAAFFHEFRDIALVDSLLDQQKRRLDKGPLISNLGNFAEIGQFLVVISKYTQYSTVSEHQSILGFSKTKATQTDDSLFDQIMAALQFEDYAAGATTIGDLCNH